MPPKKTPKQSTKKTASSKQSQSTSFDEIFDKHHTKTVISLTNHCTRSLAERGDLSQVTMLSKLRDELSEKLNTKFRNDKFLDNVKAAFLIHRTKYEQRPVANFVSNAVEPFHLPELRQRFASESEQHGTKSRAFALSDEQLVAKLAEFIALEVNADLNFQSKKPVLEQEEQVLDVQPKKQNKMIVATKGLTDLTRIFESLAEARFIEKVNQELITSIFQKRMEDGTLHEWTPNQYSAQKCNAFPSNRDALPPQTSSEQMVNFVNALLNLMSPEAKRKLNRS